MHNAHAKNTVRYYILLIIGLAFFFFSNDFGLLDVQKTAIIMAAGIDREGEEFILSSQVAIPQDSKQGKATQSVEIVSRGKTVADAFEEINAKTGWYPKLVFCRLLIVGENAASEDCFSALDYFLRDEYFSDNCQIVTCAGYAKDLLNQTALVDATSSVAIEKVLSQHAARVGTVLPTTLREFSIGYFSDGKSSFLPIVATKPQQEKTLSPKDKQDQNSQGEGQGGQGGQNAQSGGGEQGGGQSGQGEQGGKSEEKPVFSAKETALFLRGKKVATLSAEETFAYNAVKSNLQLAPYTVAIGEGSCTLVIKQNAPKISLKMGKDGSAVLKLEVTLVAGAQDFSTPLPLDELSDAGDIPDGVFAAAIKKLSSEITSVFEKAKSAGCDLFGVQDLLVKHKPRKYLPYKNTVLQNTIPEVTVRFKGLR